MFKDHEMLWRGKIEGLTGTVVLEYCFRNFVVVRIEMNDTLKSRVSHCSRLISTPSVMNNLPLAQRRGNNIINGNDLVKVRLKRRMDDNDDEEDDEDEDD